MRILLAIALLFSLTGCATIVNRRTQKIPVSSNPAGANVAVNCGSAPAAIAVTPAIVSVSRRAVPCNIAISKAGYATQTVTLARVVSRAFWANLLWSPALAVIGYTGGEDDCDAGGFFCTTRSEDARGGFIVGILPAAIGGGIDATTGAMYKRVPARLDVQLQPAEP